MHFNDFYEFGSNRTRKNTELLKKFDSVRSNRIELNRIGSNEPNRIFSIVRSNQFDSALYGSIFHESPIVSLYNENEKLLCYFYRKSSVRELDNLRLNGAFERS